MQLIESKEQKHLPLQLPPQPQLPVKNKMIQHCMCLRRFQFTLDQSSLTRRRPNQYGSKRGTTAIRGRLKHRTQCFVKQRPQRVVLYDPLWLLTRGTLSAESLRLKPMKKPLKE